MSASNRWLNSSAPASEFLNLAATDIGRKAFVGDAKAVEQLDSEAYIEVANANSALSNGVAKVEALARDETRLPPERHAAAAKVAADTIAQLERTKATLLKRADQLFADAVGESDRFFTPNHSRSHYDAEIVAYIRDAAKKPDGIVKVHELVKTNRNVANVMMNAESFLLGIAPETHSKMRFDAVKHHMPATFQRMEASNTLRELAPRYDRAIGSVRTAFYSPAIAAKVGTRVHVE